MSRGTFIFGKLLFKNIFNSFQKEKKEWALYFSSIVGAEFEKETFCSTRVSANESKYGVAFSKDLYESLCCLLSVVYDWHIMWKKVVANYILQR